MNLEQLIDDVYSKHQAELKAKEEAEELKHQQWTEEAIFKFSSRLDEAIPPQLQETLGIKINGFYNHPSYAEFEYRGKLITIITWGDYEWRATKNGNYIAEGSPEKFFNSLLIALGKIREDNPKPRIDPEVVESLQATFNRCYKDIKSISESTLWKQLCEAKYNDPEMKTNLGDVLHYLGETIDDIEEVMNSDHIRN